MQIHVIQKLRGCKIRQVSKANGIFRLTIFQVSRLAPTGFWPRTAGLLRISMVPQIRLELILSMLIWLGAASDRRTWYLKLKDRVRKFNDSEMELVATKPKAGQVDCLRKSVEYFAI